MASTTCQSTLASYCQRRKRKQRIQQYNLVSLASAFYGGAVASTYYRLNFEKNPQHTSKLTGQEWMEELLAGHPKRIRDNLGISQEGFLYLEDLLIEKAGLQPTRYMTTTE
jgi:hypothetical protein